MTGTQLRELHQSAWRSAFPGDADADWAKLSPTRRREMFLPADAVALPDIAGRLRQVIDALAELLPRPQARYLRGLRVAFAASDDPALRALRQRATDHGDSLAVNITQTVAWLATSTPDASDRQHTAARNLGVPIVGVEQANTRLEEALREAELKAFERQRQIDES